MNDLPFCADLDLFNDVIVTLDDVELWLDNVPISTNCEPFTSAFGSPLQLDKATQFFGMQTT